MDTTRLMILAAGVVLGVMIFQPAPQPENVPNTPNCPNSVCPKPPLEPQLRFEENQIPEQFPEPEFTPPPQQERRRVNPNCPRCR